MNLSRILPFVFFILFSLSTTAQVGINATDSNPDPSAMLDVASTDKGVLISRMGSSQRTMISNPANGLMVYDTITTSFWYYDDNKWNEIRNGSKQITLTDLIGSAGEPDFSCLQETAEISTSSTPNVVAVEGKYAYVAHFATSALNIYDISDLTMPMLIGNSAIAAGIFEIKVAGNYAYLLQNNMLRIVNISDPTNATEVGNIGLGIALERFDISGNYAYVISSFQNSIQVVDISNPASPSLVTTFGGGNPRAIDIKDQYAHTVSVSGNNLRIVDISNPASPSLTGTLSLPNKPSEISVSGNYAFVLNVLNDSLDILDVSIKNSPSKISSIYIGNNPYDLTSEGSYALVTDYDDEELIIIDATDPFNPSILNSLPTGVDPIAVEMDGGKACVIDDVENEMKVYQLICPISTFSFNPLSNSFDILDDFPGDDLGNHKATQNIELGSQWLSGDGDDEGVRVDNNGNIGLGTASPNSATQVNGSFALPYTDTGSSTGTFTVDDSHYTIRVFNSISTLALPDPASMKGRIYILIGSNGISSKTITVGGSGIIYSDVSNTTISNLNANTRIMIQSDGTNWIVIGN